jgi:Mce-associated membrane protein
MKLPRISRFTRLEAVALALLVAATVAASVVCVVQLTQLRDQSEREDVRDEVLAAARTSVLALTDIDASTTDDEMDSFFDGMTENLVSEFKPQAGSFRRAMVENKVRAKGSIVAIGIKSIDERSAKVVVAATARVANARIKDPQDRSYRLSVGMKLVNNRWLVDSMEFVS